jgi:hypothetical protein
MPNQLCEDILLVGMTLEATQDVKVWKAVSIQAIINATFLEDIPDHVVTLPKGTRLRVTTMDFDEERDAVIFVLVTEDERTAISIEGLFKDEYLSIVK